jgi:hypothetical protein
MNTSERVITYEPVDCEGLATILAEDAWKEEVKSKGLTIDQLYETVVVKRNDSANPSEMVKQVRPEWAYEFFALRENFLSLIGQYKMSAIDETCAKAR